MPKANYRVTQEREVIISAVGPAEATRKAIKLFDKKECYILTTVKREK